MKKIVKLTESDLIRIVKRVISEEKTPEGSYNKGPHRVAKKWDEKTDNSFFTEFIETYPTKDDFNKSLIDNYLINDIDYEDIEGLSDEDILDNYWNPETESYMLETEFSNYPGTDLWIEFSNDLTNSGW